MDTPLSVFLALKSHKAMSHDIVRRIKLQG